MSNLITGEIIKKGFVTINGERIAEDCKIDFSKIHNIVNIGFDSSIPIGELKSITEDAGSITCEFRFVDLPAEKLNWIKRFINKMFSLVGLKKPYSEPKSFSDLIMEHCGFGVGGIVTEREGNIIKGMDLMEVSLIRKNK